MAKRSAIEALDDLLRDLMEKDELFGGKVIVLGGDFRQTLPVVPNGSKHDTIAACLTNSYLWQKFHLLQLDENMRALLDPIFTDFLLRLGDGNENLDEDDVTLPKQIVIEESEESEGLHTLIEYVYPNISQHYTTIPSSMNRAILTTKNTFVDQINEILIQKFQGEVKEYVSFDETLDPNDQGHYEDLLHSLTPNGMPPHRLILKKNAPIILLRNMNPIEGLCNGTRLFCKNFNRNVIRAEIAFGDYAGKEVFIHRIPLQPATGEGYTVPFKRTQFPVKLCFAMTINKAQGQTLDIVGIYLKEPIFSHGQLYVALSRARRIESVKVEPSTVEPEPKEPAHGSVLNFIQLWFPKKFGSGQFQPDKHSLNPSKNKPHHPSHANFTLPHLVNYTNVRGVVIKCLPIQHVKKGSETTSKRDVIIVNEEKKLLILTLWNPIDEIEGNALDKITNTGPLVFAMRVKMTTFYGQSITTSPRSAILINPPVKDDLKLQTGTQLTKQKLKYSFGMKHTRTLRFCCHLLKQRHTSNRQGNYKDEKYINWNIKCPLCKEKSEVQIISRAIIEINDGTGTIAASISSPEIEKLIPLNPSEIKDVAKSEKNVHDVIASSVQGLSVVTFVRSYLTWNQQQQINRFVIVKLHKVQEHYTKEQQILIPSTKSENLSTTKPASPKQTQKRPQPDVGKTKVIESSSAGTSRPTKRMK
ncbi:unnamed protein product [Lactuca saligna]|uniref:ATP-dependent DNA helicase n=1 Tax=Lactuca saligna TaxID=75948 RepID=A0AA35Z9B7_LACSI|nr:unnamed protein product [Lactuca saligna]